MLHLYMFCPVMVIDFKLLSITTFFWYSKLRRSVNLFVNGITVLRFTHTLFLPQPRSQLFYARSHFLPLFCPIFCPGLPSTFFQRVLRPLFVKLTSVGRSRITDGLKGRVWRKDVHKNKEGLENETRISHRLVDARSPLDSGCFTKGGLLSI